MDKKTKYLIWTEIILAFLLLASAITIYAWSIKNQESQNKNTHSYQESSREDNSESNSGCGCGN